MLAWLVTCHIFVKQSPSGNVHNDMAGSKNDRLIEVFENLTVGLWQRGNSIHSDTCISKNSNGWALEENCTINEKQKQTTTNDKGVVNMVS